MLHLSTDVLIVGAGGAGMYAAVAAARSGASVILLDKSLVGRGGATVMAQMTVAAALGQQEPDHWTIHLEDTLRAGRGLCNEELSALVCEAGPKRILEMESWGTRWAREGAHIKQEMAAAAVAMSIFSTRDRPWRRRFAGNSARFRKSDASATSR